MLLDCHYVVVLDRYQVHVLNGCASEQGGACVVIDNHKICMVGFLVLGVQ